MLVYENINTMNPQINIQFAIPQETESESVHGNSR